MLRAPPPTSSTVLCKRCDFVLEEHTQPPFEVTMDWLRARCVPSPVEQSSIEDIISMAKAKLKSYDEELSWIQSVSQKLERNRELLLEHVQYHQYLISPIRYLPNEVLVHIFSFACDESSTEAPLQSICKPRGYAPLNLGLVCHLWRDIVLSQPQLWSNISVDFCDIRNPDRSSLLLNLQLRRSKTTPLIMTFHASFNVHDRALVGGEPVWTSDDDEEQILSAMPVGYDEIAWAPWRAEHRCLRNFTQAILRRIVRVPADRRRHLRLLGYSAEYFRTFGWLRPFEMAKIDCLRGNLCDHRNMPTYMGPDNLRTVRLDAVDTDQPWSQSQLLSLLVANKKLESATLTVSSRMINDPQGRRLYRSSLSCLDLQVGKNFVDTNLLPSLFDFLRLPCLTSLTITFEPTAGVIWPHEQFTSFLHRSECALKKLECHNVPFEYFSLDETLHSVSSLTHLTISYPPSTPSDITEAIIAELIHGSTDILSTATLPSLTHLDLQLNNLPVTLPLVHEMIASRITLPMDGGRREVAQLEEVTLRLPTPSPDDADQRLTVISSNDHGERWPRVYVWNY